MPRPPEHLPASAGHCGETPAERMRYRDTFSPRDTWPEVAAKLRSPTTRRPVSSSLAKRPPHPALHAGWLHSLQAATTSGRIQTRWPALAKPKASLQSSLEILRPIVFVFNGDCC